MQYSILLVGVMVFVFYQFTAPPVFFNQAGLTKGYESEYAEEIHQLEDEHQEVFKAKRAVIEELLIAENNGNTARIESLTTQANLLNEDQQEIEATVTEILQKVDPDIYEKDSDYIFISFVMKYLPHGLIGLLIAVIFSAAMSSTSSELNALASTTTVDFYTRMVRKSDTDKQNLFMSRVFTVFWGVIALLFAFFASQLDNLIQAVNILGSVFYGPILGIFMVAFILKFVKANAVFIATVISEIVIIALYFMSRNGEIDLTYLWFNPIGAIMVIVISAAIQILINSFNKAE